MDTSDAHVRSARGNIDGADKKIVHDRFHVTALLSKAVDNVRRADHKELPALNDDILKGSRYYGLTGFERLTERQTQTFGKLLDQKLKTGVAWSLKEMLRDLWLITNKRAATAFFRSWYDMVVNTGLKPLISAANTIHELLAHVVNYCTHGITNAVAEGLNSKVMAIERRVGGYRNRETFKTAVYF